ncbi:MAG: ATP-binding cassette domain-containing protein [bacterium]|nr:ATP-binding cassette domain-containing protein [Candidatus Kapabacteria bacterium]
MIELRDVSLSYDQRVVLDRVSMTARDGRITAVLGPSGSGKSTILKLMLGLISPMSGSVSVDGEEINRLSVKRLQKARRRMGMVFQSNALFDSLTVNENLAFFLRENLDLDESLIDERVREQVGFAGLEGYEQRLPDALSGGMRKRLAIGRALIFGPRMVLLDEPTVGLDPVSTRRVHDVIRQLREHRGLGAVLVTHIISDVFALADDVIVLYKGRIIFDDTPDRLTSSTHPFIASFLRESEEAVAEHLLA